MREFISGSLRPQSHRTPTEEASDLTTPFPKALSAVATCMDHCKFIGAAMWQYDPDCGGCTASLLEEHGAQTPGACASWCQYEGPATWKHDPYCQGCTEAAISNRSAGPACMNYCQFVGVAVWQYNPDCQACPRSSLTQRSKKACKDYCQHEPANLWQYDAQSLIS